jgi:hypothetical protein
MNYPFVPKSTTHLEPGQFWPIPLSNGRYGCGVVLAKLYWQGKLDSRIFFAGLLDWCGDVPPQSESIENCHLVTSGALHIKAIREIESEIMGKAKLKDLPPNPSEKTDEITTMGYNVLNVVAEKRFALNSKQYAKL